MRRTAEVYQNADFVGLLYQDDEGIYRFEYDNEYLAKTECLAISLTLPTEKKHFASPYLFSFFANMVAEGANRKLQLKHYKLDENDDFGLLLATSSKDSIGAIFVKQVVSQ